MTTADTLLATEDTPVTFAAEQLLVNDTDLDSDTLTIASVTIGPGGSAVLNGDGSVTFTPDRTTSPSYAEMAASSSGSFIFFSVCGRGDGGGRRAR